MTGPARVAVLFGILMIASLLATRFLPPAPLALSAGIVPVTRVTYAVAENLRQFVETLVLEGDLRAENERLTARVNTLADENRRLTADVRRLEQVTRIRASISPAVALTATVISTDPSSLQSKLIIDKGADDGVERMMTVTVPGALVGVVDDVTRHQAIVRTIVDPETRVSVTIEGKGGRFLAQGVAGGLMRAESFGGNVSVKPGDTVITLNTGGGVFPSVRVGEVASVLPSGTNSLGQTIFIRPAVDVAGLEEVFLLRAP